MFYEPDKYNHGLPYNPFKSITVPRPIGWISTVDRQGRVNLAPYSQFQNIGYDPPYVLFSSSSDRYKHSALNAQDTGEFVTNMATYDLRDAVNITAQPVEAGVDEIEAGGPRNDPVDAGQAAAGGGIAYPYGVQILLLADAARICLGPFRHRRGRTRHRRPHQG